MISLPHLAPAISTLVSPISRQHFVLGFASSFFAKLVPSVSLALFVQWVVQACRESVCDVYFDHFGRPLGYVRWRKQSASNGRLTVIDIVDLCSQLGEGKELLKCIRHYLLRDGVELRYARAKSGKVRSGTISNAGGIRSRQNAEGKTGRSLRMTVHAEYLEQSKSEVQRMIAIGEALVALNASIQYSGRTLKDARSTVSFGLGTGQLKIFRDSLGIPTGALTWMWLSTYTLNRLKQRQGTDLHLSEWNEGNLLCFRDIAPNRRSVSKIAEAISGEMFPTEQSCYILAQSARDHGIDIIEIPAGERPRLGPWLMTRVN